MFQGAVVPEFRVGDQQRTQRIYDIAVVALASISLLVGSRHVVASACGRVRSHRSFG